MKPLKPPPLPHRHRPCRAHPLALALTCLLLAGTACAQTAPPAQPARPAPPAEPELLSEPAIQAMETTRQGTRDATDWLARRVDSWFGDRPFAARCKLLLRYLPRRLCPRRNRQGLMPRPTFKRNLFPVCRAKPSMRPLLLNCVMAVCAQSGFRARVKGQGM